MMIKMNTSKTLKSILGVIQTIPRIANAQAGPTCKLKLLPQVDKRDITLIRNFQTLSQMCGLTALKFGAICKANMYTSLQIGRLSSIRTHNMR